MAEKKKYCIGADIGGTTVKLGLFDAEGNVLEKWEIPSHTENEGAAILPDLAASIRAKLEERKLSPEEVAGVGVGVPGPVSEEGVVPHTANLGWGYKEVTRELSMMTGLPCKAGNDANVAALGEMWMGGAKGYKNVLLLTLGTGVGGGIIIDGRIVVGTNGAGGEIGHIHVDDSIPWLCGCGNQGCLEQVASANGIVRLAKWMQESGAKETVLDPETTTAKDIWDAVKEQDGFACEVAERFGSYLGLALANIASTVDPEVFVVGGGVSKAGPVILDYIKKYYVKYTYKGCRDAEFVLATLGNDAGIFGSARLVIEE